MANGKKTLQISCKGKQTWQVFWIFQVTAEAYSEPYQTYKMERFTEILKSRKPLTISANRFILNVWHLLWICLWLAFFLLVFYFQNLDVRFRFKFRFSRLSFFAELNYSVTKNMQFIKIFIFVPNLCYSFHLH